MYDQLLYKLDLWWSNQMYANFCIAMQLFFYYHHVFMILFSNAL